MPLNTRPASKAEIAANRGNRAVFSDLTHIARFRLTRHGATHRLRDDRQPLVMVDG
jgi:hypothetical protein